MHSFASKASAALLAAGLLLSAGAAFAKAANLIKNGGFDSGPQPSYYTMFPKGSTAIPGWIVTMGSVDVIGPNWHDADGGKNSIDVDGTPGPGAIAQSFATKRGTKYTVWFALAGNPECGPTIKRLLVTAGGASRRYTFDTSHTSDPHMGWQRKSFTFTAAAGARSTLTFTSLDPKGSLCGPAIDAVRVY
ncbi:MAG TPA: choice-of-anchor C family protein [Candidatus Rubrimentiphilum sp.]|nr:choice-of-anchor C family protein [Candidatus Rubrimentiphilum sp.]